MDDATRGYPPVVLFAANNWDDVKFADRHLAERLAEWTTVLYVDPPMSRWTPRHKPALRAALAGPRLRSLGVNLLRLTPVVTPFPERPGVVHLTRSLIRRWVLDAMARHNLRAPYVIHTSPLGVSPRRLPAAVHVYWAQDDYVAGAELFGVAAHRIRRGEGRMSRQSDLIVAATPGRYEYWQGRHPHVALIPYGCDTDAYAACRRLSPAEDVRLPRPIVGYCGGIGARVDLRLLEALAAADCSLLLVGPRHGSLNERAFDALLRHPNVQWVGGQRFEALPRYFAAMDVAVVPYTHSAFNENSFPLKALEYLAAGLPVVATGLKPIRWLDTEHIRIADEPNAFVAGVREWLADPTLPGRAEERQAFAARHSWAVRAVEFLQACCAAQPGRRTHGPEATGGDGRSAA